MKTNPKFQAPSQTTTILSQNLKPKSQGPKSPSLKPYQRSKQLSLFSVGPKFFGGRLLHGKRRRKRPLSSKHSIHIVMRSLYAKGKHSLLAPRNRSVIHGLIEGIACKFRIQVYRKALAGNHLHLMIRFKHLRDYKSFIRFLSGQIASHVMGQQSFKVFKQSLIEDQKRGDTPNSTCDMHKEPTGKGQQFWVFRPFTRVLHWGRDFRTCAKYHEQNILEAFGFIRYKPRKDHYAKWTRAWAEGLVSSTA